jgi:hypothetical protein
MASYLYRQTTVPTSEKKFTISTWMKISADTSVEKGIIEWYRSSSDRYQVLIDTTGKMRIHSQVGGSTGINIYTDMLFRDPASWYHIVIHNDTAESSATDRFKLWVNGEAQTFSTYSYTYNGSNINCFDGTSGDAVNVGVRDETSSKFFDGSLADTYYVDGSLIAYTQFGQTDSTSGIWKPNLSPTISSFGNAGFRLKYENSGNLGLDSSGNSLNMTASGTITQNVDTPSNNFATLNAVYKAAYQPTFSTGNLTATAPNSGEYYPAFSSLGVETGKWYMEYKIGSAGTFHIGICSENDANTVFPTTDNYMGESSKSVGISDGNGSYYISGSATSYGSSYTSGDIIGLALDMTNKKLYVSKNGTFFNSANPASGSGGIDISGILSSGDIAFFAHSCYGGTGTRSIEANFGQGFFGTTAVASANADANGHGAMEYAVPSGYYTLNTKNIKEFG